MNIYIVTNEYSIEGGGLAYSCHAFCEYAGTSRT